MAVCNQTHPGGNHRLGRRRAERAAGNARCREDERNLSAAFSGPHGVPGVVAGQRPCRRRRGWLLHSWAHRLCTRHRACSTRLPQLSPPTCGRRAVAGVRGPVASALAVVDRAAPSSGPGGPPERPDRAPDRKLSARAGTVSSGRHACQGRHERTAVQVDLR